MRWHQRLFRRARTERQLDAELRFHIAQQIAAYVATGMSPEEARRRARLEFGGPEQVKEECRDVGAAHFIETLIQDIRFGLRQLRRNRGFTAVAVLTLALGIGATTAIFSVVNTVLLEPLPYPNGNRIVQLGRGANKPEISVPEFMAMRQGTPALQDFTLYMHAGADANLTGGDRPQQVRALRVSAGYFQLFGASMALGRPFNAEEDRPGGPHVVVISYGLWRSRYGGNAGIVGSPIELAGQPYVVTGVLARTFHPPAGSDYWRPTGADIWMPLQADPNSTDPVAYLRGAAMVKPGETLAVASIQLKLEAKRFRSKFPRALAGPRETFVAVPMREVEVSGIRSALLILFGAVSFVLLIACANVANLLLARATLRKREIAIRTAVGAGRTRIIRQLLTESVLLSLGGGVMGLVFGFIGVRALLAINPGNIPRIGTNGSAVTLDWRVLVFTVAVSLLTGMLFGLIPAFHSSRSNLSGALKESDSRSGSRLRQNKSRSILVISEMALALVLLAGAALLIRTLVAMRTVDPGFDPHNILTMRMALTGPQFKKTSGVAQMVREAERQVGTVPGIIGVSAAWRAPLDSQVFSLPFTIIGRPLRGKSSHTGSPLWSAVSPQFFRVFQIPLIRGRFFTKRDDGEAPGVAVINQAMARKYWPNANPIGAQIDIGKGVGPELEEPPREIVGVVGDVREIALNHPPFPMIYVPAAQVADGVTSLAETITPIWWTIRTRVPPYSLVREVRRRLRRVSGGLPVAQIQSMDQLVIRSTAQTNFNMTLLTIFACVALLLAAIGIYGVISYSVQQRTQEIGIRMALGATPGGLRKMVVRQGMTLAVIGVGIGAVAAVGLTRLIAKMLYGVNALDPVVFVSVAILLSLVALLATCIPARRAAKVDPMLALRHE